MQAQAMHAYCPRCPHCQRAMRFAAYMRGDHDTYYALSEGLPRVRASQQGQVYRSALAMAAPQVQPKPQWQRRTPVLPLTIERAFLVPSAVAFGSGAFTFMWSSLALRVVFEQPSMTAIDGGLFVASIAATAGWVGMLAHAVTSSTQVEQAWGGAQPSTQHHEEPEVEEDPDSTRLHRYEIVKDNGGGYRNIKYPRLIAPDKLRKIAKGVLAGRPFSEREWESVINSKQFRQLRNELVESGLMAWKVDGAPQQGVTLTEDGREFFVKLVEESARNWAHA